MSTRKLPSMSVTELVDLYEQISLAEGQARADMETGRANQLIRRRWKVAWELRNRPGDARKALWSLYAHKHPQLRLNVANSTYALDPEKAKSVMREIADSNYFPWAGDAGMSLWALEAGISALPDDPILPGTGGIASQSPGRTTQ